MSKKNNTAILFKHSLIVVFVILVSLLISSCNKDTTKMRDIDTALSRDVMHQNFSNVTIDYILTTVDGKFEANIYINDDDYMFILSDVDDPIYMQAVGYTRSYEYTMIGDVWYRELAGATVYERRRDYLLLGVLNSGDFIYDEKTDLYFMKQEVLEEFFIFFQLLDIGSGTNVQSLSIGLDGTYITTMELVYQDDDGNPASFHFKYYDYNQTTVKLPEAYDVDELLESTMSADYNNFGLDAILILRSTGASRIQIEYDKGTYKILAGQITKYFVQDTSSDSYKVIYQDQDGNWAEGDTDSDAAEVFGYIKLINMFKKEMFFFSDDDGGFRMYSEYNSQALECLKNENILTVTSVFLTIVDEKISTIQIVGSAKDGYSYTLNIELSDYNEISISLPIV